MNRRDNAEQSARTSDFRRQFEIPGVCKWCEGNRTLTLELEIVRGAMCLNLICRLCDRRWTPTPDEIDAPDGAPGR